MLHVQSVVILGGGSAGFLSALTLRQRLPWLNVTVLRSPDLGIIGVGEGTTVGFPQHLHGYLGIDPGDFFSRARPQWKLGLRLLWGPRPFFDYSFAPQIDTQFAALPRPTGFYLKPGEDFSAVGLSSAIYTLHRVFHRDEHGKPILGRDLGYHVENELLVSYLEAEALRREVRILDVTITEVFRDESGLKSLRSATGETYTADLYVDASGFRSRLLGDTLGEPFVSYRSTLFCDKAIVGGWERTTEPIQPYTTAETTCAGWCWQIEHEKRINRGYVFSSDFLSETEAEAEFRALCPLVERTRLVPFRTGRYERAWIGNVVAVGNASGFVEPLEATALSAICDQARALSLTLAEGEGHVSDSLIRLYNRQHARTWDGIRRFLAVHYRFNTRLDTPFWQACRESVDLAGAEELVEYYQQNGPVSAYRDLLLTPGDSFGMEGYLAMLVGQEVPHARTIQITDEERATWHVIQQEIRKRAAMALTVAEALAIVRDPSWRWPNPWAQA